uniref:Uncharacterized protein n=1 Tax=Glossina pallidipes TaxID=7398 RepID=A0A1B0A3I7_GLOPL
MTLVRKKMKSHFIGCYFIPLVLADIYLAESLTYLPPKEDDTNTSRQQQAFQASIYGNQSYDTFGLLRPYETNRELHVERAREHFHLRDATRTYNEKGNQPSTYEISAPPSESSKETYSPEITFPVGNNYHLPHHHGVNNVQLIDVNYPLKAEQENHFQPNYFPYELKNNFKGSEHLPPAYTSKQSQRTYPEQKSSLKNSEYFSSLPATKENRIQFDYAAKTLLNTFKASEYFPPLHSSVEPTQHAQISPFKGVDYLPPHRSAYPQTLLTTTRNFLPVNHQEAEQRNGYFEDLIPQPYRGPDYLPPVQDEIHSIESAIGSFKGSEYLPPTTDRFSQAEKQYKISGYNGFPGDSRYNPEYKGPQMEQQSETLSAGYNEFSRNSKEILKASDQRSSAKSAEEVKTHKTPLVSSQQSTQNIFIQPHLELTDKREFPVNAYKITEENHESYDTNQLINDLQILPVGYDFDKPEHPEVALALLHSEDPRLHKSKTAAQPNYDRSHIPIYNRPPQYRQKNPLDNSYIPSHLQYETSPHPVMTTLSPGKNIDSAVPATNVYLPPVAVTTELIAENPEKNYIKILQGTAAKDFPTYQLNSRAEHLLSLANTSKVTDLKVISYQGAVKGEPTISSITTKRTSMATSATPSPPQGLHNSTNRPFLVYGTPVKTKQFEHFNIPSEYYIPTARNSQDYKTFPQASEQEATTLRYKTSQVLSAFMPKNTQEDGTESSYAGDAVRKSATLPIAKSVKLKVRTVQIMNSEGVKTLKILDTLDANGIKTIKILGTSEQEEPMGQHQLIRVISGSDQQTVQTVKIYNDH